MVRQLDADGYWAGKFAGYTFGQKCDYVRRKMQTMKDERGARIFYGFSRRQVRDLEVMKLINSVEEGQATSEAAQKSGVKRARKRRCEVAMNQTRTTRLALALALAWACAACEFSARLATAPAQEAPAAPPAEVAAGVVIDIPRIIGLSVDEVEKAAGKPKSKTKITSTPEEMPGEFRDYEVKGTQLALTVHGLMVRYYRGRAVHMTLDLPESAATAEEALRMAGIDVGGAEPRVRASRAVRWSGTFGGVDFKDVAALKMGRDGSRFSSVQATLAQ
jgi:hypothetical protein